VWHESLPPPKQCRITQFQTDAGSSSSGSGDPQLHTPSFDFNPSLPFPDPQRAEVSDRFIDDILLNLHLHTWTHQAIDDSNNEGPEDAPKGDAVEAPDSVNPGTNDFSDGEDIDIVTFSRLKISFFTCLPILSHHMICSHPFSIT